MAANPYLDEAERAALASACVGIAGAGGLGSNCAAHLVRAGVGRLVIADFDVVSESNLNRQFFFRDQIGMKKVDALKENLLRIEPFARIETACVRLDFESACALFGGCGIVVEALDAAEAKAMLLRAAAAGAKPVVTASGLAGWGRSNAIRTRVMGGRIVAIGDGETAAGPGAAPQSPRVGIAAAMEANAVVSMILKKEI